MYNAVYADNDVDIILTPTTAIPTTPISATEPYVLFKGQYLPNRQLLRVTAVIEPEVGAPGLSIPIGLTTTSLPVGLQLQARAGMHSITRCELQRGNTHRESMSIARPINC